LSSAFLVAISAIVDCIYQGMGRLMGAYKKHSMPHAAHSKNRKAKLATAAFPLIASLFYVPSYWFGFGVP
jgi:hypothetical protein